MRKSHRRLLHTDAITIPSYTLSANTNCNLTYYTELDCDFSHTYLLVALCVQNELCNEKLYTWIFVSFTLYTASSRIVKENRHSVRRRDIVCCVAKLNAALFCYQSEKNNFGLNNGNRTHNGSTRDGYYSLIIY